MTSKTASTATDTEVKPSATVYPFPLRHTPTWRWIADRYMSLPEKGRNNRAAYAAKVIAGNIERLRIFGVAQSRIDGEIAQLKAMFWRLDGGIADEKVRA
jgi:hypothetical protein